MRGPPDLEPLLAPGRTLRPVRAVIVSALPESDPGAPYDKRAAAYDRLVGNRAYNRVAWGTAPVDYEAFATEAVAAGEGGLLDAGCGSATFTAAVYRDASRPLVLVDRSVAMLERAAERVGSAPAALLHGDVLDLPFAPGQFETVACFGVLHVFDEPWSALAALRDQLAPDGQIFASMLVADRPLGRAYLAALHRAGEVGPPRRAGELTAAARELFGPWSEVTRTGSMAWLRARLATVPAA